MSEAIQFETAEYGSGNHCIVCQNELRLSYFKINDQTVCGSCADKMVAEHKLVRSRGGRITPAMFFGAGAAVAGAAIYAIIALATGYEFALISILIGWMVGKAMMRGAQGVGSRKLQIAAVIVTYLSITGGYIPGMIVEVAKMADPAESTAISAADAEPVSNTAAPSETPANDADEALTFSGLAFALAVVFGIALVAPVLGLTTGVSGILGIIILAVGLMQAWKETQERPFAVSGPFEIAAQAVSGDAPA